ncbi:MAG: IclR family transcriptional regulator C-terminal domain-containing protein [Acidobacteriota bacterium]
MKTETTEKKDRNFTSSLARGLSILEAFDPSSPRLGITELSKRTALSKTTVFRLVHTLRSLGYIVPVAGDEKYSLGPRVLSLGFAVLSSLELREAAQPYLEALSREIEETVNLAVLDGYELIYIERIRTQQIININLHVGSRLPLYNTSMGRVLAADQDSVWLARYIRHLSQFPEARSYWAEDGKRLRAILEEARTQGFAVNNEELCPGLRSVASPVRNRDGRVAGAVNIAVSSSLYSLKELRLELLPPLLNTAAAISAALGFEGSKRGSR